MSSPKREVFFLPDAASIDLAWECVQITGAPHLLPILEGVMGLKVVAQSTPDTADSGSFLAIPGENAQGLHDELTESLGIVVLYATNLELANRAARLLNTIQAETA